MSSELPTIRFRQILGIRKPHLVYSYGIWQAYYYYHIGIGQTPLGAYRAVTALANRGD